MDREIVTRQQIEHVCNIARIKPTGAQLESLTRDANAILEYFSLLDSVPEGVKPRTYVLDHASRMREDTLSPTDASRIKRGFAREQDNYMQAPKSL